jgi:hypothetical protein
MEEDGRKCTTKHTRLYWNQKVRTSDNAISFESKKSDVMEEKLSEKT